MAADRENLENQVRIVLSALEGKQLARPSPIWDTALEWVRNFPTYIDPQLRQRLISEICRAFSVSEPSLLASIDGHHLPVKKTFVSEEAKLRALLPTSGWFTWYDELTLYNEAPLSFHIFSSLCVLGAALGRRCWIDMGHFNIYPNYCVILIGPTGRVKKTTAADIARDFVHRNVCCPLMSDEPTPEAMASALVASGHQFIYAPEMAVFFGKQRYKEGMISKMLRMLDSPKQFEVETQKRGKETVTNLALTFLGCTTPSLLATSMPEEVTSSGFMNRFILIYEQDTDREFYRPRKGDFSNRLDAVVQRFNKLSGVIDFTAEADSWLRDWYSKRKKIVRALTDEVTIEVLERAYGHLLRTAMLIHLAQCDNFNICVSCLESAKGLIDYAEKRVPSIVRTLKQANVAREADYVLDVLTRLGGAADHSTLLRRVGSKMNAQQFKQHVRTLVEQGLLREGKKGAGAAYFLVEDKEV